MKKTLVIGDIHLRHKTITQILNVWSGPIIQVGDWFDNFGEKEKDTIATAKLFKHFVHRPDAITLMNDFRMNLRAVSMIGLHFIRNFPSDYLWTTYGDIYHKVCKDFNLTPTKSIHLALRNGQAVGISPLIRYVSNN